jgi:hypothetical protein
MPQQEVFLDNQIGDKRIQVLKSYDAAFARESFGSMNENAL